MHPQELRDAFRRMRASVARGLQEYWIRVGDVRYYVNTAAGIFIASDGYRVANDSEVRVLLNHLAGVM